MSKILILNLFNVRLIRFRFRSRSRCRYL